MGVAVVAYPPYWMVYYQVPSLTAEVTVTVAVHCQVPHPVSPTVVVEAGDRRQISPMADRRPLSQMGDRCPFLLIAVVVAAGAGRPLSSIVVAVVDDSRLLSPTVGVERVVPAPWASPGLALARVDLGVVGVVIWEHLQS